MPSEAEILGWLVGDLLRRRRALVVELVVVSGAGRKQWRRRKKEGGSCDVAVAGVLVSCIIVSGVLVLCGRRSSWSREVSLLGWGVRWPADMQPV